MVLLKTGRVPFHLISVLVTSALCVSLAHAYEHASRGPATGDWGVFSRLAALAVDFRGAGVTRSTGRTAELLLRRGGVIVLYERDTGASDNPTLKQKPHDTFQSQSHMSSCQGGRREISATLSRRRGRGVFPRSLIFGSMAETYRHITQCPTDAVLSPDGGRAPGGGTLARASQCLFGLKAV